MRKIHQFKMEISDSFFFITKGQDFKKIRDIFAIH